MPHFRKKPIVVEARQLTYDDVDQVMAWCGSKEFWSRPPFSGVLGIQLQTGGNTLNVRFGDWVLQDVAGDFYPCPREVFEATYEFVEPESVPNVLD